MSKLSGKIFPYTWKNFSVHLEKFFRTVGGKVKVIFFSQVEKSPEKNLNNSVVHRKVQNNPENKTFKSLIFPQKTKIKGYVIQELKRDFFSIWITVASTQVPS